MNEVDKALKVRKLENKVVLNSNSEVEVVSKEVGNIFDFSGEIPEESISGFYLIDGMYLSFCKKASTMVVIA